MIAMVMFADSTTTSSPEDNLSSAKFPLPNTPHSAYHSVWHKSSPGHVGQCAPTPWPEPHPGHKLEEKGRGYSEHEKAWALGEPQDSSSSDPFKRGSCCCLDLHPRKIFRTGWPGCLETLQENSEVTEPRPTREREGGMVSSSLQEGNQLCQGHNHVGQLMFASIWHRWASCMTMIKVGEHSGSGWRVAWCRCTLKEDRFFTLCRAQFSHLLKQEYGCISLSELLRCKMRLPKMQLLLSTCIGSSLQGSRHTQRYRMQFLSSSSAPSGVHDQQWWNWVANYPTSHLAMLSDENLVGKKTVKTSGKSKS